MTDKPKASPALGLEITSRELKGALLSYQNRKPALNQLFSIALNRDESTELNVKPLYIGKEEKQLRSIIKKSLVVTAIPTRDVLVRQLTVPLVKDRDIESVLEFQAEPIIPYPIDIGLVDKITLNKEKERTKLTVVAVKIDQVTQHLEQWHSIDIEPEVISCVPVALAAYSELFYKSEHPYIHINIGNSETVCLLIHGGKLLAAQSLRTGLDEWAELIAEDRGTTLDEAEKALLELNFDTLSEDQYPNLAKRLGVFKLEITRVVYALRKQVQKDYSNELLVTGEGAAIDKLPEGVLSQLEHKIVTPEPPPGISQPLKELQKYAIAIGMALTALPKAQNQINFRQKELSYPYPWKRIKKPMTAYIGLCLLLSAALYFFGNAYIASKEDSLKREYINLLVLMKKPPVEFEKEVRSKGTIEEKLVPGEEISVISLTQQDLQLRLNTLEKEIRATPDMFPLYPNTPRVSDVLAWLSTHPLVVGENKEKTVAKPRIQMESFSYKMVKKPEQNKQREKYQAKVEIEFTTPTPRFAREFHDILLAPNDLVDPKGDIKWSTDRGRYRASFFLKDKTVYPTMRR